MFSSITHVGAYPTSHILVSISWVLTDWKSIHHQFILHWNNQITKVASL